jgi:hypothetical protein
VKEKKPAKVYPAVVLPRILNVGVLDIFGFDSFKKKIF